MLQSSWVRKKVRHYLSVLILTFAGQSYFNLILIFKYQTLSLHWSNVNQRFSINQRFFDGNFISDGLNTDHRSLSYSRGHVIGTFQRCEIRTRKFSTSDVGAIGPTPQVRPSCRHKILARFLKPGLDRKLRLMPTKPCYLSFPASLVDPQTENRSPKTLHSKARSHCNFAIVIVSCWLILLIYRGYLVD